MDFRFRKNKDSMKNIFAYGLKFAVFNFIIVGIWGVLMRYKMAFPLPIFNQKNLLEAHSHFGFYGWIALAIYFLILIDLKKSFSSFKPKKYLIAIIINIIGALGMLVSFTYGGYYWLSIVFSAICMLGSYVFFFFFLFDYRKIKSVASLFYLGGLFLAVLSSAGVFYLSYTTSTEQISNEIYQSSIYYYLHYQYNGFFIFSCIGLFLAQIKKIGGKLDRSFTRYVFWLMLISTIFTYGLSVIWLDLSTNVLIFLLIATLILLSSSFMLTKVVYENWNLLKERWTKFRRMVLIYVGIAWMVKLILQLMTNVPFLVKFAFEYRDVAIAYLHLILLFGISTFLLSEIVHSKYFKVTAYGWLGMRLFLILNFLNQVFLGLKALSSILYFRIPAYAQLMFILGALIISSLIIILMNLKVVKRKH